MKFLEGMQAFKQVRDPRALQLLAEIPDDHKLKPLALVKVGDSCQRSGKYKESMQAYEKAIALAPDATGGARVSLAGLYYSIGAFALAEKVLDDALQQDPEHRTAFETRGLVRFDQMRYSDALEDFQRVLSSPGQFAAASPRLLESYCRCIVKLGETELINEFAEEYLSLVDQQEVKLSVMNAAGQYDQVKSEISKNEGPEAGFLSVSKPALEAAVLTEDWTNAEQLLDKLLTILPRDIELFELAVKTYAGTQNAAKLAVAEENLKQLKELEASLLTAMQKVGEDIETADDRVAVARLFQELGRADAARIWFSVTATIDPTYADEAQEVLVGTTMPRKPLVEFSNDSEPASPADDAGKDRYRTRNQLMKNQPTRNQPTRNQLMKILRAAKRRMTLQKLVKRPPARLIRRKRRPTRLSDRTTYRSSLGSLRCVGRPTPGAFRLLPVGNVSSLRQVLMCAQSLTES